jgi:hypothetical protein
MASKPQLELPVLDEVVDPDDDRARLLTALDELNRLIDRVPKGGRAALSDEDLQALKEDLNRQLAAMFEEMAERLKHLIPEMVEKTLREHLSRK